MIRLEIMQMPVGKSLIEKLRKIDGSKDSIRLDEVALPLAMERETETPSLMETETETSGLTVEARLLKILHLISHMLLLFFLPQKKTQKANPRSKTTTQNKTRPI